MPDNLKAIRQLLRDRLQRDYISLKNYEHQIENINQLIQRTVDLGESNSVLLIGPRGCGKSSLINALLVNLLISANFRSNSIIVHLNGYLHTDDKLALRSATVQMQLENVTNGKIFGSFAENLEFLLACLKSGSKRSKSVIFILEEFDLFCAHSNQTLLYNLFDVSQSSQAPICVLGVTCRLDVVELLEKRVKSRFSHRQIFLFPNSYKFDEFLNRFEELLLIPIKKKQAEVVGLEFLRTDEKSLHRKYFNPSEYKLDEDYAVEWNKHINALIKGASPTTVNALRTLYELDNSESFLKSFLLHLVAQLYYNWQIRITEELISEQVSTYNIDSKIKLLCGLSVLELCLVIAMKHHSEIYDRDPFNFQIIYARFGKFAKCSSSMQGIERGVALKAFERLCSIEMILPLLSISEKVQKEFKMYKLALTYTQINTAIQKYNALPTEVAQWSQNSIA